MAGWTKLPFDKQGRYVLPPGLEEAIRQMQLPMTRFYALGDEPFGLEAATDKTAEFLILANGSWNRAVPCRIDLRDFAAGHAVGVVLSHADPDGYPLLERKEDLVRAYPVTVDGSRLTTTLPPHAVVFITLERAGGR